MLLAVRIGDVDDSLVLLVTETDRAGDLDDRRLTLRFARFEDFLDARETGDDVFGRNAAGVEGSQRQLRTRFTNRLRRDDADGRADIGALARR